MNNKKVLVLIIVFAVAIITAIPLSIFIASTTHIWLQQNGVCFYPNPVKYCTPIEQFQQWELDDLNHASAVGLLLLWLGIGIIGVLSLTVFRRMSISAARKWTALSVGLIIAVLLPLLTWRAIINPTFVYACALSLPIALLSIVLFLMPQTKEHTVSGSQKELAKPDEELLYFQQVVEHNPQSFEAWANLGYKQHKLGLNDDALASANKAITLNNKYARAWMVRGAALSTMDRKEVDALAALDVALENDQNNVDALYYKGRVYVFQELDDAAHRMFDKVLKLDPMYKEALLAKGTLYLAVDNYDEVLDVANLLIRRFPDDAVGWRMLGQAFYFQGDIERDDEKALDYLDNAVISFNKALEIDPTDSNTYFLKAQPFVAIGDYTQALEALNRGLQIDPSNALLRNAKADIVGKRRNETASKISKTAGRMALGGGKGLLKGYGQVGKMFGDVIKDDMKKF